MATTATLPPVSSLPAANPMAAPTVEKEKKQKKDKKDKKGKKKDKSKKKKKAEKEANDPKEPKPIRQAVGVIVIDKANQKVLLIQGKNKKGNYVLPRDDCKTDPTQENPEEAALRLLKEKAGVQTQAVKTRIGTYSETNKKGKVTTYHWMYEVNDATILENSERQRVWVSYEEALQATEKKRMSHLALQKCSLAPPPATTA